MSDRTVFSDIHCCCARESEIEVGIKSETEALSEAWKLQPIEPVAMKRNLNIRASCLNPSTTLG